MRTSKIIENATVLPGTVWQNRHTHGNAGYAQVIRVIGDRATNTERVVYTYSKPEDKKQHRVMAKPFFLTNFLFSHVNKKAGSKPKELAAAAS